MSREHFEAEKKKIFEEILLMSAKVEEDIRKAAIAFRTKNAELAEAVRADDAIVGDMQAGIENACGILIATQQPVAQDMRDIVAVIKVVDELERIGDYAVHLAKLVLRLKGDPMLSSFPKLAEMAEKGADMLHAAISGLMDRDVAALERTAERDAEIDALHKAVVEELMGLMRDDPMRIPQGARVLTASGQLERLGDHVKNICEDAVFMVDGRHVELG
jgi:phosphate transport system protein